MTETPDPEETPIDITPDMLTGQTTYRETRIDFERGLRMASVVTIVLIVTIISVFIWQMFTGSLDDVDSIIAAGALQRDRVLSGEFWRLITCMFLHGGIEHIIGNLLILYVLGIGIEHAFGAWRTCLIYLLSGLGGGILSLTMHPGPSVGASGAIFGLAGAMIIFFYKYQHKFYLRDKRIGLVLLIWAAYTVGLGFLDPQVDNYAHIGGLIAGAILALIVPGRARVGVDQTVAHQV